MDDLPPLGTAISDVAPRTVRIYAPFVLANKEAIKSTACHTFAYGPHPRQALDVYTPSKLSVDGPVLLFLHGGGLVRGAKILPVANGLIHANVGHYFAETYGLTTVIPDYRLMSHGAAFPSGGEDIALAVEWVAANLTGQEHNAGPRDLFIMGNSAGGIHLSQFLYAPDFRASRAKLLAANTQLRLRGAVMLSVPFHFAKAHPDRAEMLRDFFGTPEQIKQRSPLGLLQSFAQSDPAELGAYSMLVLNGEFDPVDEILEPKEDFVAVLGKALHANYTVQLMTGHNHISPPWSLGTGIDKEEAWGRQVGCWINYARRAT